MKKLSRILSLFVTIFFVASGCGLIKKDAASDGGAGGGGAGAKSLNSLWYTHNQSWRFNFQHVPKTDVLTNSQIVFADNSVCNCSFSLNGTNDAGAYKITNCAASGMTGSMVHSVTCSVFETTSGTYTKTSTSLCLMKFGSGGGCSSDLY